jgi:hypothetical protein
VLIGWQLGELEYLPWGWKTLPFAWCLIKGDCKACLSRGRFRGAVMAGTGLETWLCRYRYSSFLHAKPPTDAIPFVPTAASPRNW